MRKIDQLDVFVSNSKDEMGELAARHAAEIVRELQSSRDSNVRMVFAAAPSQDSFLEYFLEEKIDWTRITAFHMDEYIGLSPEASQRFGNYLTSRLFSLRPFGQVHLMQPGMGSTESALAQYAAKLNEYPIDLVIMGIGENGHIAFNDPPVADFEDTHTVKVVELDALCRQQQVNDGAFESVDSVPTHAFTMTVPALMSAKDIICIVPGPQKRHAVTRTLFGPISTDCPASVLRSHPSAKLYLDVDSSPVDREL